MKSTHLSSNRMVRYVLFTQNVSDLKSKTKDFYLINCLASGFDVIALSEAWLNPSIFDCDLSLITIML